VTGTMTWVGLDVHARSTHAAAIDVVTGELRRARFGAGSEPVVAWLSSLGAPVRAVYEAGPTGFGRYRATRDAGVLIEVVAPGKTARPAADRVKTDRKDAELLARLAMAGQLRPVAVPDAFVEAARHLTRTREQVRGDLLRARHRVSKLLLSLGRVYPGKTTWNRDHRRWLGGQTFEHATTEMAFVDLVAAVDGLVARKDALDERLSRLATDQRLWPTVARLRAFRGIDTLTALALHLELGGDWQRFGSPRPLFFVAGPRPVIAAVRAVGDAGLDHQDRLQLRAPARGRVCLALRAPAGDRRHPGQPPRRPARPRPRHRLGAPNTACTASTTASPTAASPPTWPPSPSPASSPGSSGPPPPRHDLTRRHSLPVRSGGRRAPAAGTRDGAMGSPHQPRPLPASARRATKPAPRTATPPRWPRPHHQPDRPATLDVAPRAHPTKPNPPHRPPSGPINHAPA
jgi:transposase